MRQVALPHPGELVVAYGGGRNTIGMLILMAKSNIRPRAIVMADPGSERKGTVHYRDVVLPPWLDSVGFPRVEVVSRVEEGRRIKRAFRLETLREECRRSATIPSIAYGMKKCSAKHKGDASRWWARRQAWIEEEKAAGRKVVKATGYDVDERHRAEKALRVMAAPGDPFYNPKSKNSAKWERERFTFWFPLIEAGMGLEDCVEAIEAEGLPVPPKSACTFCPSNTLAEWEELRREDPQAFADAVAMSRDAAGTITDPETVGLMRCNPHGKRQLHVWAEGGYGAEPSRQLELAMPCESECGT